MLQWKQGRESGVSGKVKKSLNEFCATANAHSEMLRMIPIGNVYLSVMAGSITSLIKVRLIS